MYCMPGGTWAYAIGTRLSFYLEAKNSMKKLLLSNILLFFLVEGGGTE